VNRDMTSEAREVAHDRHTHPTDRFYWFVAVWLIVFTAVEVAFYYFEEWGWVAEGVALTVILVLSAAKFLGVVMFYMHLKMDHKLFAGIFVFPAVLGALVISALWLLNQYIHPFHPREAAPVQIIRAPVPHAAPVAPATDPAPAAEPAPGSGV
jgi:cytochrome c oxidase subunit IV